MTCSASVKNHAVWAAVWLLAELLGINYLKPRRVIHLDWVGAI